MREKKRYLLLELGKERLSRIEARKRIGEAIGNVEFKLKEYDEGKHLAVIKIATLNLKEAKEKLAGKVSVKLKKISGNICKVWEKKKR